MKRKVIYLILTVIMLMIGYSKVNAETTTKEWCFGFDKDTGTITNYKNYAYNCPTNKVVIPSTIRGTTVERIGARAFMYDYIDSVVIPDTVKVIGNLAFASNNLKQINIPDTVTKIGYGAFNDNPSENIEFIYDREDSTKLISVAMSGRYIYIDIPSGVKTIGTKAFYGLSIDEINLSKDVTTLEDEALYGADIQYLHISDKIRNQNYDIDIDQIPNLEVIYHEWYECDIDYLCQDDYYKPYVYAYKAQAIAYNKVKLNWEFDGSFTGVQIYKYNPKTKKYDYFTTKNSYAKYSSIYITKDINPGQNYYFKIRSYVKTPDGKTHYSPFSDAIKVRTSLKKPVITLKKQKNKKVKISWKKIDGATGYSIYRYNSKTKKYTLIKNTNKLSYTTKYSGKKKSRVYYKIKAYKTVNGKKVYSSFSKAKSIKIR